LNTVIPDEGRFQSAAGEDVGRCMRGWFDFAIVDELLDHGSPIDCC